MLCTQVCRHVRPPSKRLLLCDSSATLMFEGILSAGGLEIQPTGHCSPWQSATSLLRRTHVSVLPPASVLLASAAVQSIPRGAQQCFVSASLVLCKEICPAYTSPSLCEIQSLQSTRRQRQCRRRRVGGTPQTAAVGTAARPQRERPWRPPSCGVSGACGIRSQHPLRRACCPCGQALSGCCLWSSKQILFHEFQHAHAVHAGDETESMLASATLPAPLLLEPVTSADTTAPSVRCAVRLGAGRLMVTAAASNVLHFSAALISVATCRTHGTTGLTAAPLPASWTLLPAPVKRPQSTNVTGALATPSGGVDGYRLHPAVLDGSLQLGAAVSAASTAHLVCLPL